MKIDRSNYEIWFIDWIDGNLNEAQAEQLKLFLSENPDLEEELLELSEMRLNAPEKEFKAKRNILRSPSDLSNDQFEYLCAGFIENDLSENEKKELLDIISEDTDRQKDFDIYNRLRLTPPDIRFVHKRKLLRITPIQKTIRITLFTGLSAAASVAILILSLNLIKKETIIRTGISQSIYNEGRIIHSAVPSETFIAVGKVSKIDKQNNNNPPFAVNVLTAVGKTPDSYKISAETLPSQMEVMISRVVVPKYTNIENLNPTLLPQNLEKIDFSIPEESENRWALGRFIAKSFREKVLKEVTIDDSPIKAYEIAEAGVTGINKLLGWQMAFEKNSDPNGEVRSVYFSSKILKIQTPVNKPESAE
jgi:hypothetical protein